MCLRILGLKCRQQQFGIGRNIVNCWTIGRRRAIAFQPARSILINEAVIQTVGTTSAAASWAAERAALVIAHPGHELRIHHWLERAQPVTFVLTDGSGHTDQPRIASTTRVLERVGARSGDLYGPVSDRLLYQAILASRYDLFAQLVDQLAQALQRERVTYVVGDAVEGVNPGHDVCRLVLNAALQQIERTSAIRIRNMEYPVEGPPDDCPEQDRGEAILLKLDDGAYHRKITAARGYPELAAELDRVLALNAAILFRTECIRPVRYGLDIGGRFAHPCVYERYGEKQVASGIYKEVIRYGQHIEPLSRYLASC